MRKYFEAQNSTDPTLLKAELIREWVYGEAESLLVGKAAVPETPMRNLDMKFIFPRETAEDYPLQESFEGSRADYIKMSYFETNETMQKWQQAVMITDEAKARRMGKEQLQMTMDFAAQSFALKKDAQIFSTLIAGAGGTDAASGLWSDNTTEIASDLALTIGKILTSTKATDADIRNVICFYPIQLWGYLKMPVQIGDILMSIQSFIQKEYRVKTIPTRQLKTDALVVIGGKNVARHVVYTGNDIPTVEHQRLIGKGEEWLITQYFKTFIMPETEGATTNNRIRKITGVASAP